MIPLRLNLRNFMCYRENVPTLSFAGIHTACISGDNGYGKSALIDAMTWALWGKARAKSDVDLIAQGQSEMSVEFDFIVSGQTYRIIRKYAKPKTRSGPGHPVLEFQMATENGFRTISGNTLSLTEQKIRSVLHMDYDTFVNSAFLRQGHADEFTDQPPVKRKEVLANILGLSIYEGLETRAKNAANELQNNYMSLKIAIQSIDEDLINKSSIVEEASNTSKQLSRLELLFNNKEYEVTKLQKLVESLEGKKTQLMQLETYINEAQRTLEDLYKQLKTHEINISEYESLISQRENIDAAYEMLISARKLNDDLNEKLSLIMKYTNQKNLLDKTIENSKNNLLRDQSLLLHKISELSRKVEYLPRLKSEMQIVETKQKYLSELDSALETKKLSSHELRTNISKLELSAIKIKDEVDEINRKIKLLNNESGAKCPLCEQALGIEERHKIMIKYDDEIQINMKTLRSTQSKIEAYSIDLSIMDKEITVTDTKLKQERARLQSIIGVMQKSMSEAMEAMGNISREKINLTEIERRLTQRDYAHNEQKVLNEISEKLRRLNYDAEKHDELRRNLAILQLNEKPKQKLDEALRAINAERETMLMSEKTAAELQNSIHNYLTEREKLSDEVAILPHLATELSTAQDELKNITIEIRQTRDTYIKFKEKLEHYGTLENSKVAKLKLLTSTDEKLKIYQELTQAFGKKGVQALLIEMVLPEIEVEADRLLAKMTDNRMHIKIETQKETKKGDVAETLVINVSDELGTRNYELFSGGEAFRINFAIRIALSRLLARRAGAPLPTLIIDEGFGTQDNSGIEKLKEAINSIQDDFEKIIVITHIDELKDAFPSRIDVIKSAEGSSISVN